MHRFFISTIVLLLSGLKIDASQAAEATHELPISNSIPSTIKDVVTIIAIGFLAAAAFLIREKTLNNKRDRRP